MAIFRSRSHFRAPTPTLKLGPVVMLVLVFLVVGGVAALVVLEPRPPLRHFEVPISNERPSR